MQFMHSVTLDITKHKELYSSILYCPQLNSDLIGPKCSRFQNVMFVAMQLLVGITKSV